MVFRVFQIQRKLAEKCQYMKLINLLLWPYVGDGAESCGSFIIAEFI